MVYLTKQEKKLRVLNLLEEGNTYREIQRKAHVTPNFISTVVKETFGEKNLINNSDPKLSKNSRAIKLLSEGKIPLMIAQELDLDADQMHQAYSDYISLNNLSRFNYLIMNKSKEKISLLVELVNLLDKQGIKSIESIKKIFNDIKYHTILKQEINRFSQIKNELNYENSELQNQINEKDKLLETKKEWLRFIKSKNDELKNEISKKQETMIKLKNLFNSMNNLEAFQDLKNVLIENIENVILVEDKKFILNFLALCEAYKDDAKLRNLIHDYSYEFKDIKLSIDNIEERVEYIKNSEFNNSVLKWITKLFDTYSLSVFNLVLDRYFGGKNLCLSNQNMLD